MKLLLSILFSLFSLTTMAQNLADLSEASFRGRSSSLEFKRNSSGELKAYMKKLSSGLCYNGYTGYCLEKHVEELDLNLDSSLLTIGDDDLTTREHKCVYKIKPTKTGNLELRISKDHITWLSHLTACESKLWQYKKVKTIKKPIRKKVNSLAFSYNPLTLMTSLYEKDYIDAYQGPNNTVIVSVSGSSAHSDIMYYKLRKDRYGDISLKYHGICGMCGPRKGAKKTKQIDLNFDGYADHEIKVIPSRMYPFVKLGIYSVRSSRQLTKYAGKDKSVLNQ